MLKDTTLNRQLKYFGFTEQATPIDSEKWREFLYRIEQTYDTFEKNRYTYERTLNIVSKELQDLFNSLENAENIALMGNWSYNLESKNAVCSSGIYKIFKGNFNTSRNDKNLFGNLIHPNDRKNYEMDWDAAIETGNAESICRVILGKKTIWVHIRYKRLTGENNEYTHMLMGTVTDITMQKKTEEKLASLNSKLIDAARRAGMSEVATSVLHNIGNVLNSISISCETITNVMKNSKIANLKAISDLLTLHKDNLYDFLKNDAKGKIVPEYLDTLAKCWLDEKENIDSNIHSLSLYIQHIKDIVDKQQSLSGFLGLAQKISLANLLNDAISIVFPKTTENDILIQKNFNFLDEVKLDKIGYMQIFVNLIRNAKESLDAISNKQRKIILSIELTNLQLIFVTVEDNGLGISSENLRKIFSYGFTTKEKGSGIGLHASILSAREMGADIKCYSEGVGKGVKFIIEIPYNK